MPADNNEILVIGHHNPDTDAICSALAYADFYRRTTGANAVACHLDEIGPEAAWLLQHLALAPPRAIADVFWRVADVMRTDTPTLLPSTTLREAGLLMRRQELSALPVVDDQGRLVGIIPRDMLADRYLDLLQLSLHVERGVAATRAALDAQVVVGEADAMLEGQVWVGTFSPQAARELVQPGDIVIIEDDVELQHTVVEAGTGCLIVARSAPLDATLIEAARQRGTLLLHTAHNSLAVAALLEQSEPVERVMQQEFRTVTPDELLSEAQQHLRSGNLASLPVVDDEGRYLGLLLRRVLVLQNRRQIILTDHNHAGQAAGGATESDIIAIIDHHNLGGMQTLQPLFMQIEPVGCCSTLVAEAYQRHKLTPSPALAGAMLGAILSDTVQFRSPTTTTRDQAAAEWLAELSGENSETLARSMFRARLPTPAPPPEWWVSRDWKIYSFGETKVGIAQMELVDIASVIPPVEVLRAALLEQAQRQGLTSAFLMLTDILDQSSVLVAADQWGEQLAARAFNVSFQKHLLTLHNVMSRKKQVVPPLAAALAERN